MRPSNFELNANREEHCIAITYERKRYKCGNTMFKRSLRPFTWQSHSASHTSHILIKSGACLEYLARNTNILLPKFYANFKDNGAGCLLRNTSMEWG
ncbi:hypothetical protein PgNI_11357 [Pyricularia grisea]|uniref:Uncharacterized protein n=1 Tax=Pyricularia grisea TaxID=148305 RepID=A0A6P8AP85_PYRGI|nr:hypothetical protein PgNI_11357 [Pyricularia grisea]TLD03859.1 hypothetical protein PgNI_11357 [Pyricularia grisea]